MRESTSSAVRPASTANGSTGVCRKRDFFFMRGQLNHKCALKRVAEAEVERRTIRDRVAAIVSPRDADRRGEGQRVRGDDIERQLGAGGRLDVSRVERARPRVARVGEDRGVQRLQKERPRADAALWTSDRPTIVGVDERDTSAGKRIRGKSAQQADRLTSEI